MFVRKTMPPNELEILEAIVAFPGSTAVDLMKLTDKTRNAVKSTARRLVTLGYLRVEKGRTSKNYPENKYYSTGNHQIEVKPKEPGKKIMTGLKEAVKVPLYLEELKELRIWKQRAIARFPELDVDAAVLQAREIFAKHNNDQKIIADILIGKLDTRPPMLALIEALGG